MVTAILMIGFLVLLLMRVPVSIAMGAASIIALVVGDYPLMSVPQWMGSGVMSYTLMAVPFFIFAGNLMNEVGITQRIFNFASALVGHFRGGLAQVNILASMIFAGITGSFVADTAGLGTVEMKAMTDRGYDRYFAAAVTVSSSTLGPIIPPSVIMIIYAMGAQVSIARMFLAGIIPGILIGIMLMILIYFISYKNPDQFRREPFVSFKTLFRQLRESILAVISPLIILWGMVGGMVTPTEAGILAIVWSTIVGFVYRELSIKRIPAVLYESFLSSAHIMFLIAVGNLMGWIIAMDGTSESIATAIISVTQNKLMILILINLTALLIGCLIEPVPALLICYPIFEPIVTHMGIDLIHFGVFLCLNLVIGMLTPPVGLGLYVVCSVCKVEIEPLIVKLLPFLAVLIMGLLIITFIPVLSLWLPKLLMPY